jgi:hypothetical protein
MGMNRIDPEKLGTLQREPHVSVSEVTVYNIVRIMPDTRFSSINEVPQLENYYLR